MAPSRGARCTGSGCLSLTTHTLTTEGLPLNAQTGKVLVIACGALAREIIDIKKSNGWDHLDLTCLPANLHLYPEKIVDAVRMAVDQHKEKYGSIFVAYADCGTGRAVATRL